MPTRLDWTAKGFEIIQETDILNEGYARIRVNGNGPLDINLRVPYWADRGFEVKVNGEVVVANAAKSSYVTISRTWAPDDLIEVTMPFSLRLERSPQNQTNTIGVLFYGPYMLVEKGTWSGARTRPTMTGLNLNDLGASFTKTSNVSYTHSFGTYTAPRFTFGDFVLDPYYTAPQTTSARYNPSFNIARSSDNFTVARSVTGGNGSIASRSNNANVSNNGSVNRGSTITFTATPNAGFQVKQWTLNGLPVGGNTSNSYVLTGIQANAVVTVEFESINVVNNVLVNYSVASGTGTIEARLDAVDPIVAVPDGGEVAVGSDVRFTASPASGWKVSAWTLNGVAVQGNTTNSLIVSNIQANTSVTVAFEREILNPTEIIFSIAAGAGTIDATANGVEIISGAIVERDSTIVFTANPGNQLYIGDWTLNGVVQAASRGQSIFTVPNVQEDINVTVAFVPAGANNQELVDEAVIALTLPDLSALKANIDLPTTGANGTTITWASSSPNILPDGTVLRPPSGGNANVVLTATVSLGDASATKTFDATVIAFEVIGRNILNVKTAPDGVDIGDHLIEVPVGSEPSLPYRVWVEYTDGHGEWRAMKWPWATPHQTNPSSSTNIGPPALTGVWTPSRVDTMWRGYPVGRDYTVTGWITGFGSNHLGHPITVNCKVIPVAEWEAKYVPSSTVVADHMPPGSVTLTGANRLTSNTLRSIARTVGYVPNTYLWNYRDTFGIPQPPGASAPGGWENATTMLRGHGVGHYLSSMALAYGSGLATTSQMNTLRNNMRYMVETMRDIQELTFVQVPADHPNSIENGGTGWREAHNIWPHYPADKATDAPDWPYPLLSEITIASRASNADWPVPRLQIPALGIDIAASNSDNGRYNFVRGRYWLPSQIPANGRPQTGTTTSGNGNLQPQGERFVLLSEKRSPEWFGYGYLNAIPPQHPAIGEAYRGYADWQWAPYYGWHKQLAGLLEIYYLFDGDPAMQDVADKALQICTDMARWIADRLTKKCRVEPTRDARWYGNLNFLWYINITGEYGGANESIARAAFLVDDDVELEDGTNLKDLLIRGSEMFNNRSYWEPLITNGEIMSISGNSHANSRIPNFPGVLWSYRGNDNPDYWKKAENFFNFNNGRYRYFTGNVGTGEWYQTPYTQIQRVNTNNVGMETCCAYNLMRLSRDLACFNPYNAKYIDYYERLMYNQIAGSLSHRVSGSAAEWVTSYQFHLGANTTGGDWRGTTPGNDCCGGTGAENHVRYTDAIYLSNDDKIWVNMYIPSFVNWDAAGVRITQEGVWPAQQSRITVSQLAGQTAKTFDMALRVPEWASKDFDIKLNGVSIAASFVPSSYVTIENVALTDVIEVFCPFQASIDYGPDRRDDMWAGVFFYGPLSFTGGGNWSTVNVNADLSNVVVTGPFNEANTAANTPGTNNNLYRMTVTGQSHTNVNNMTPTYHRVPQRTGGTTFYFRINQINNDVSVDRGPLYERIIFASALTAANYTEASFNAMLAVLGTAIDVYNADSSTQAQINTQLNLLNAALNNLMVAQAGKADLLERIETALAMKARQDAWDALPDGDINKTIENRPYAPYGYARMLDELAKAQVVYDGEATQAQVDAARTALDNAIMDVRPGYMPEVEDLTELQDLIAYARTYGPAAIYTPESFDALQEAITYAHEEVVTYVINGSSTINHFLISDAIALLNEKIAGLELDETVAPPVITAISPGAAVANASANFSATVTQIPGVTLKYAWSVSPAEGVLIANAAAATTAIVFPEAGAYEVTLTVTDHLDREVSFSRAVTVASRPAVPFVVSYPTLGTRLQAIGQNHHQTDTPNRFTNAIDGVIGRAVHDTYNTFGVRNSTRHWFQLEFADPVTIYAADIMYSWDAISGTGGVQIPVAGTGSTLNIYQFGGTPLVQPPRGSAAGVGLAITNETANGWTTLALTNKDGTALQQIGRATGPATQAAGNSAANTVYNFAGFAPVTTTTFRTILNKAGSATQDAGIGIQDWRVYALEPMNKIESISIQAAPGELTTAAFPAVHKTTMIMFDFATDTDIILPNSDIHLRWTPAQITAAIAGAEGDTFTVVGTNNTLGYTLNVNVTITASGDCDCGLCECEDCGPCGDCEDCEPGECKCTDTETVTTLAPTCTEPGVATITCVDCKETSTSPIPALGHNFGAWGVTTAPGCLVDGVETRTCQRAGCTEAETRLVEATGHTNGPAATCTSAQVCTVCNAVIAPALGHAWGEWVVTTPATCLAAGVESQTCTREGCTVAPQTQPIPVLGHAWGAWVVTLEPTIDAEGSRERICGNCQEKQTEAIARLTRPHVGENLALRIIWNSRATNTNTPTFTTGSITVSSATGPTTNTWNRLTAPADGRIPTRSNVPNTEAWATWGSAYTYPIWIEYNFGAVYTISSTSVFWNDNLTAEDASGSVGDGGIRTPGEWRLEYFNTTTNTWVPVTLLPGQVYGNEIDKFNDLHFEPVDAARIRIVLPDFYSAGANSNKPGIVQWQVWGTVPVACQCVEFDTVTVPATCTEPGSITKTCKACGKVDVENLPALGHSLGAWVVTTAPTCTAAGVETRTCTRAGCTEAETRPVAATGHTNGPAATCTTAQLCTVCNAVIAPALGHSLGAWVVTTAPTCTAAGVETRTCTRAGCTEAETRPVAATGHTNGSAATCEAAQLCTVCNAVIAPALGHSYVSVVTAPTCTASGFTTHTCSRCNHSYTDTNVPALGHNYVSVVTAPTCTASGFTTHTCSRCNHSYTDTNVPALGHVFSTVTVDATCVADGSTTTTCSRCDYVSVIVLPALGHKPVVGEEKLPTGTEAGYRIMVCEICGIEIETIVLPATCQPGGGNANVSNARLLSVSNSNGVTTVRFTATVVLPDGSSQVRTYSFEVPANNSNISGRYVFPSGHELAGSVLTYDIKGNGSNIKAFSIGDALLSSGHRAVVGEVKQPTATEAGYRVMVCANCGVELQRIVLPATGTGQQPDPDPNPGETVSVTSARFLSVSNMNRVTTVTFTATVLLSNGTSEVRIYSFEVGANNNNVDGRYVFPAGHELAGSVLTYDIKGNGSNVKAFSIR